MTASWTPSAWEAINRLAELDLAHYPKHVHNRDAFLGKARAERVIQHREVIDRLLASDPSATAEQIAEACNPAPVANPEPEWARRRDYDRTVPACRSCDGLGLVPAESDGEYEAFTFCPECHPRARRAS